MAHSQKKPKQKQKILWRRERSLENQSIKLSHFLTQTLNDIKLQCLLMTLLPSVNMNAAKAIVPAVLDHWSPFMVFGPRQDITSSYSGTSARIYLKISGLVNDTCSFISTAQSVEWFEEKQLKGVVLLEQNYAF